MYSVVFLQEEKRAREMEEKKRRLEEAEKRRQAMLNKGSQNIEQVKPNFVIQKRTDGGPGATLGGSAMDKVSNLTSLGPGAANRRQFSHLGLEVP